MAYAVGGPYGGPELTGGPTGDMQGRKLALIKKLSGGRAAGGGQRAGGGTPFGAIPKLGFHPGLRSLFGRPETFNYDGMAPGLGGAMKDAPVGGFGPAAGGPPMSAPMSQPTQGTGMQFDSGGIAANPQSNQGTIPPYMQEFMNGGATGGNISAWLAANPWFMQQYSGG